MNRQNALPGAEDRKRRWRDRTAVMLAAWAMCVAAGFLALWDFAYTPGAAADSAPAQRPADLGDTRNGPLLVVFVHPRCSCSEATMEELARIRRTSPGLPIQVYFYAPAGVSENWSRTSLWKEAQEIPGVQVRVDRGGQLATRYGANTSGQVFYYGANARLAFSGGITAFRGHYGDNDGRDSIAALARGIAARHITTPVFGCSLRKRP